MRPPGAMRSLPLSDVPMSPHVAGPRSRLTRRQRTAQPTLRVVRPRPIGFHRVCLAASLRNGPFRVILSWKTFRARGLAPHNWFRMGMEDTSGAKPATIPATLELLAQLGLGGAAAEKAPAFRAVPAEQSSGALPTLIVDASGGGAFTSIQAAIRSAPSGACI